MLVSGCVIANIVIISLIIVSYAIHYGTKIGMQVLE